MPGKGQFSYSADELERCVDTCIEYCLEHNEPPENFILMREAHISDDTMSRILDRAREEAKRAEDEHREPDGEIMRCAEGIKKWDAFKTYFWVRMGLTDPKVQSLAIFALKQPRNGGFTDKPVGSVGNIEVVIKSDGVGGKAFG